MFVLLVALFLYFATAKGSDFTSKANLVTLFSDTAAPIIILALGEVMLLICGEIDLSVGFIYQLSPFIMYFLIISTAPRPAGDPDRVALGPGDRVVQRLPHRHARPAVVHRHPGHRVHHQRDRAHHVRRAAAEHPAAVQGIGHWIGQYAWAEITFAVILTAVFHVLLTRTRWGLHTVATGGNLLGAREAGVSVARIKYGNFMLTGFLGSLVGLQIAFQISIIDPTSGGYIPMFYAVAAAVIGGTAMLGGSGTIIGAFLGGILLAVLTNGFSVIGISAYPLPIIFGGAILLAMIANVQLTRLRAMGKA